jgi:hypothetical protein
MRLVSVVGCALALCGCFGVHEDPFVVDLSVERNGLPVPDRVELEIVELVAPGGAVLSSRSLGVNGADFFAADGTSNRVLLDTGADTGALRVRGDALDGAGALVASGVVEVPRQPHTVPAMLYLVAVTNTDAGTDGGP